MSSAVRVRPYLGAEDDAPIRALIEACYGAAGVAAARFRHWHFGLSSSTQAMALAEADGTLVGVQPMEIVPHRLAGAPIRAAVLTGVMVHPAWRRQGIFSQLLARCEQQAWDLGAELIWSMPNGLSRPGFMKAGYLDPGERRLMVWSEDPRRVLERVLPAPVAGLAARLGRRVIGRRPVADPRCSVRAIDGPGEMEAEIARGFANSWPGLVQERDREWLAWRFAPASSTSYRSFTAGDVAGRPAAWAVTTREQRAGYRAGYLLDIVSTDDAAGLAAGRAALDALAAESDLVLTVVSSAGLARLCRSLGFVSVPPAVAPKRFYTVYRSRPGGAIEDRAAVARIGGWHQTLADWDNL